MGWGGGKGGGGRHTATSARSDFNAALRRRVWNIRLSQYLPHGHSQRRIVSRQPKRTRAWHGAQQAVDKHSHVVRCAAVLALDEA